MKQIELIPGAHYNYKKNSSETIKVKYIRYKTPWFEFEKENGATTLVNTHNLYRISAYE